MLDVATARIALDHALSLGADFADLFIERQQRQTLNTLLDQVDNVLSGLEFGIGVRLVYGDKVLYGYTNQSSPDVLRAIIDRLAAKDRRDPVSVASAFDFRVGTDRHPVRVPLSLDAALQQKIDFVRRADAAARNGKAQIVRTMGVVLQREQQVEIFNSEGLHTTDTRHYCRMALTAVAADGAQQATGREDIGGLLGWELHLTDEPERIGEEAARQALVNLGAQPCPSGRMPVVIGNGFGGVIFHEACGHLLETTSVARKASVFHDQMGEMIAHASVSAVDDGTIDNAWGSINIDDEGMATQHTQLITEGRLTSFLVDRIGSQQTGFARTGSGRRESFRHPVLPRMRSTYMQSGPHDPGEIIASVKRGIYCESFSNGQVNIGAGDFAFYVREGYMIEDGRLTRPIKDVNLIGNGPAVLETVEMVGNDLKIDEGGWTCGKDGQSVPVSQGMPTIKVGKLSVGGRA
jgi:TldD protein